MKSKLAAACAIGALSLAMAVPGEASPASENYAGGGTVAVAQINGVTVVDNGAAICRPGADSTGGACVGFPVRSSDGTKPNNYVQVIDGTYGPNVAYQVCVDNNGDGVCGGEAGVGTARCGDDQFFSHREDGSFANPLGPLPVTFREGCGGGFPGYVVFLCTGVHANDATAPHAHGADAGTVSTVAGDGDNYGTFCGGGNGGSNIPVDGRVLQAKPYHVE